MIPGRYSLMVYRGDTARWTFVLWANAAKTVAADLTGVAVKSQIRNRPGGVLVLELPCVVTLPNTVGIVLTAAQCAALPAAAVWDMQLTYPTGDVSTVVSGGVNVVPDVTVAAP
jgi:hypothetical protein